jgi:hypothetical protein
MTTCQHPLDTGMYRGRVCGRRAVGDPVGEQSFCGLHHPVSLAARRQRGLDRTRPQREAKAARERLHEAAPELLQALKCLMEDASIDQALMEPGRVSMARAAIAKAEGHV